MPEQCFVVAAAGRFEMASIDFSRRSLNLVTKITSLRLRLAESREMLAQFRHPRLIERAGPVQGTSSLRLEVVFRF